MPLKMMDVITYANKSAKFSLRNRSSLYHITHSKYCGKHILEWLDQSSQVIKARWLQSVPIGSGLQEIWANKYGSHCASRQGMAEDKELGSSC